MLHLRNIGLPERGETTAMLARPALVFCKGRGCVRFQIQTQKVPWEAVGQMFRFEFELVGTFQRHLEQVTNPFSRLLVASEFDYQAGRVDLIAANDEGELIAFEAKLSRWRAAVHQAYRNTSFSHYSYVVLPESVAGRAFKRQMEFERRGVGLCSVSGSHITILIPAKKTVPLQPWLTASAIEYIGNQSLQNPILGVAPDWHSLLPITLPLLSN